MAAGSPIARFSIDILPRRVPNWQYPSPPVVNCGPVLCVRFMSDARQVVYWLAYAVSTVAVHVAIVCYNTQFTGTWRDLLDVIVGSRAAPLVVWVVLMPGRPRARLVVLLASALVWTLPYRCTRSGLTYDGFDIHGVDVFTAIATFVTALIVRRLAGTIQPGCSPANPASRPQFSIRDVLVLTTVIAVLTAVVSAMFANVRDYLLGAMILVAYLWVAGTASIFGVIVGWATLSAGRRRTRWTIWLAFWLTAIAGDCWLFPDGEPGWPRILAFTVMHLGQSLLTAVALAPWWLRGYRLCPPERD